MTIYKFTVRPRAHVPIVPLAPNAPAHEVRNLQIWRDYYVETRVPVSPTDRARLAALLADPVLERTAEDEPLVPGKMVQVAYRAGIIDNENGSLLDLCRIVGIEAVATKLATTYVADDPRLPELVRSALVNTLIHEVHLREPGRTTLRPHGRYRAPERYDLRRATDDELIRLGREGGRALDLEQMRSVRAIQLAVGAPNVTDALLEALDARWSDHCAHTTWRSAGDLLAVLREASKSVANPNAVSLFEDNSGVWAFYDGWSVAIKAETHNAPTAVVPYFGQLTKVGGVLRDILGTGLVADPIGVWEYTATGVPGTPAAINGRPDPRHVVLETIRAVKEYGNTFGVPMIRAHMSFHPAYRAKPFALGGSIGLIPTAVAAKGRPRTGDVVMLIGGPTGDEGIHGASGSSTGADMVESGVQIGAPLEEVKFRQALIDLREQGCLRALTDVGGAGLNSAVGEMGDPVGVWMNTALVPLKQAALPIWKILVSESQERMLLAVVPDALDRARRTLDRHSVPHAVIGRISGQGNYAVFNDPAITEASVVEGAATCPRGVADLAFDIPYRLLGYEPPRVSLGAPPPSPPAPTAWPEVVADLDGLVCGVLSDPEIASQWYAVSQYDATVLGNLRYGPHFGRSARVPTGYWACTPLQPATGAVVMATEFTPALYEADPIRALRQSFCRVLATLSLAGVDRTDICLCDNFYTPDHVPHATEWLVGLVHELAALIRRFGTPVVSGKDSSAGSTLTDEGLVSVPPAVYLSALGKTPDHRGLLREEWCEAGDLLVQIGPSFASPAGTVAGRALGMDVGALDELDLPSYVRFLDGLGRVRALARSGRMLGPGGLAASVVTGALASDLGVELEIPASPQALFAEHRCSALVEVRPEDLTELARWYPYEVIGRLTSDRRVRSGGTDLLTAGSERVWRDGFARLLE